MVKIVEIIWMDACAEEAHINLDTANALTPMERKNVGYLLRENDKEVVIAYGLMENFFKGNKAYDLAFAIPRGCIKKIIERR